MYNLIEYSDSYSKTSGTLWQCYIDEDDNTTQSESIKYKIKIRGKSPDKGNSKHAEIAAPLKYLSNFCRTLEIPLINCKIDIFLTWFENCVLSSATEETKFPITDLKLYGPYQLKIIQNTACTIKIWF